MRYLFLSLMAFLVFQSTAYAVPVDEDGKRVSISLSAEAPVQAGQDLTIAIKSEILEGWHTYWLNAGDSGTPMQIKLDMPDGFSMGEAYWPTPEAIPYDPLVNYGYHGAPVVLQTVHVPASLPDHNGMISLSGVFDVLVCDDICIPETHQASITIPVSAGTSVMADPDFEAYRDAMPRQQDWLASMQTIGDQFSVSMTAPDAAMWDGFESARFFPLEWGLIHYASDQQISIRDSVLTVTVKAGDRAAQAVKETGFVITAGDVAYQLTAHTRDAPLGLGDAANAGGQMPAVSGDMGTSSSALLQSIGYLIVFAFLGGLILNLMPCVFPVLSIKALSIASHGADTRAGLLYTAGAVLSFVALGVVMLVLRAGGAQIGWGFQLQSPFIVMLLAWLFFVIGLSLAGFFEVGRGLSNLGNKLTQGKGALAQFMTGVLAVIVATPCTAPFMAASVGASLVLPPLQVMAIFAALGLGLAAPILLITMIPATARILPKPGVWMERFKQFLAFPMWVSAIWLVWVLARQAGADALIPALGGMLLIAFGVWGRKIWLWVMIVVTLVIASFIPMAQPSNSNDQVNSHIPMEGYTPALYDQAVADDRPLFVEMTADWCITCKVNERVALNRSETIALFDRMDIRYLRGDWTNRGADITNYLTRYGRAGVPLYVYYPKGDHEPVILPQILTPGIVKDALTHSSHETEKKR